MQTHSAVERMTSSFDAEFASQQEELAALTNRIASFSGSPIGGFQNATPRFSDLLAAELGDENLDMNPVHRSISMKKEITNNELQRRENKLIDNMQQIAAREHTADVTLRSMENQVSAKVREQQAVAATLKQREAIFEQQVDDLNREKERTQMYMESASRALKTIVQADNRSDCKSIRMPSIFFPTHYAL